MQSDKLHCAREHYWVVDGAPGYPLSEPTDHPDECRYSGNNC